jgi:hypothetical protein
VRFGRIGSLVIAGALLAACTGSGADESVSTTTTQPSVDPLPAFRKLPRPPTLQVRNRRYAIAGGHLVALGGYLWSRRESRPAGNEAIYSMRTNRWRKLDVPWKDPLDGASAVWTGRELIVVGTPCGEAYGNEDTDPYCRDRKTVAFSYRPDTDEWERLAPPPRPSARINRPLAVTGVGWTGKEAVFRASFGWGLEHWVYDRRSDEWKSPGPASSLGIEDSVCVAGGRRLVVRKHPPPPGVDIAEIVCEGDAIVAYPSMQLVTPTDGVLRLDPATGQWRELPPIPLAFIRASVAHRDGTTVLWPIERDRHYWLLPDGASTWIPVEKPTAIDVTVESDGRFALVQGGEVDDELSLVDLLGYAREQGVEGVPVPPG